MKPSPMPVMQIPTGADDWEHKVDTDCDPIYDRWLALVPNIGEIVLNVYEKAPGAWCLVAFDETSPPDHESEVALEHAPPLPAGPFASAEEAMQAGDEWCRKWAPRIVDVPGLYALRICTDGKIRTYADKSDADHLNETEWTPDGAQAFVEVLMMATKEVSALPAGGCAR